MAKLHYEKKEYKAAMLLLQEVKFSDALLNLTPRILIMKIYYELKEWDVLDSYLHSFENMVRRKKNIGYHQESYLNLIHFMRKIRNINFRDKEQKIQLIKEVEQMQKLPEKKWLFGLLTSQE